MSAEHQVAAATLALSAVVHAAVVPAHGWSWLSVLYLLDAVLLGWAAHRLIHGRRLAAPVASAVLAGSLLGLAASALSGTVPDQVAMATKVVELVGLVALWSPAAARRGRRLVGAGAVAVVAVLVAAPVWGVALTAGTPDRTDDGGHRDAHGGQHHGAAVAAGTLMPPEPDGVAVTADQRRAAEDLVARTRAALAPYADPQVAQAAGYRTDGMAAVGHHAEHPGHGRDGRVLDPGRPEFLVYGAGADGPVLLGAMFTTEEIGDSGPPVGGPLTRWHRHEQVCVSVLPVAVTSLTSPFGSCPPGSFTLARTGEMLHVWTVPGAPAPFGDLPEEWVADHLASPGGGSQAGPS
jgi:hypothetical protein